MKFSIKNILLVVCVCLLVAFTAGCANTEEPPAETPAPEQQPDGPIIEDDATPEDLTAIEESGRPATAKMTFTVEGQEEEVEVKLWASADYSFYLPASGWIQVNDSVWKSEDNGQVQFFIANYAEADAAAALAQIETDNPDFEFTPEEGGLHYVGKHAQADYTFCVKLVEYAGGTYAISSLYPGEAAEGFGARLEQIGDTFELIDKLTE